jgi:SAM-dependent methyltransferase
LSDRFDRTADRYAAESRTRDWSAMVEWAQPRPGDEALDVAAGPGMLSGALLPSVARAVALDASAALLSHAPAGVEAVQGDAAAVPFPDAAFDIVTCVNGLHHLDDMPAALREMVRVLRPGGRLVVPDYLADPDPDRARRWDEIERVRAEDHRRLPAEGEVTAILRSAGLAVDREETWDSTWDVDAWTAIAGCDRETAARVREMVGAATFTARTWRCRYVRPSEAPHSAA